jgi:hypothetical protein
MRRLLTAVTLVILSVGPGWGQTSSAPARFTFRTGFGYDQGTFGSADVSRALYAPFSLRYTASRFDIGVSSALVRIDTAGGIRLIDGVPTQTDSSAGPLQESGIGDTTIRSRFFLVNDEGRGTAKPSVTPFVKVKIPTAREERGLGTGKTDYGFGVELDKEVGPIFLFGDMGYTVVGKIPSLAFRNRPSASIGVGKQVSESVTVSSMLDWRRAIIAGNTNPAELVGVLSYRANRNVTFTPNAFVGLTNGSSDFGVGMQMSFKF